MSIPGICAECLYDKQCRRHPIEEYLRQVRTMIDERSEEDTSPLMVYKFHQLFEGRYGHLESTAELRHRYNQLVLGMEAQLRQGITSSADPLRTALAFARTGNYIDFGAMDEVRDDTFLSLFSESVLRREEEAVYTRFLNTCWQGRRFLLIADNCGEIVLDRLFVEQLKQRFPHLSVQVMVRGAEIQNDATLEDAVEAGMDRVAEILDNGAGVAGTVVSMLPEKTRSALERADVVLAKGQGNYESLGGQGWHVFYVFLCKCGLFTRKFGVPPLTGMFVEENG